MGSHSPLGGASAPQLELDDHLRLEMARVTFPQTLPQHLNEPEFGAQSTWNWSDRYSYVLAWPSGSNELWRKGAMAAVSSPITSESQTFVLYPQPQYPTIHSTLFPSWWAVTPPGSQQGNTFPIVPPPRAEPPRPRTFAEWLEEAVRKDWSKVERHLDRVEKGELIEQPLEAALSLVPQGTARDAARKAALGAVRAIAGLIKDGASDAVIQIIEERFLGGLADIYFENHPGTEPSVQRATRSLLDALVSRVLEGHAWTAPGPDASAAPPDFRGPIFAPDPSSSWAPSAQGSISPFAKIIIQGQLDPDFAIRKVIPKPFLGPF